MSEQVYGSLPILKKAGLNNQRLAFLGLCLFAKETEGKVVLPREIYDLNASNYRASSTIEFDDVFDRPLVEKFLAHWVLDSSAEPNYMVDWELCFEKGQKAVWNIASDSAFIRAFLLAFRAHTHIRELATSVYRRLPDNSSCIQLRVERDWQAHIDRMMTKGSSGVYLRTPEEIFEKYVKVPELAKRINVFLCCDTKGLDQSTDEIRSLAKEKYGLNAFLKEDLLAGDEATDGNIQSASLDFEIGLLFDIYVGLTQSTFSALLYHTKSAILPASEVHHYIYNTEHDAARRR